MRGLRGLPGRTLQSESTTPDCSSTTARKGAPPKRWFLTGRAQLVSGSPDAFPKWWFETAEPLPEPSRLSQRQEGLAEGLAKRQKGILPGSRPTTRYGGSLVRTRPPPLTGYHSTERRATEALPWPLRHGGSPALLC